MQAALALAGFSKFVTQLRCDTFLNGSVNPDKKLVVLIETATTLGVLYCLNAHGIFKEFRLPWGHHFKVTNRFQRWLSFFLSDIRRLLQFPMGEYSQHGFL